MHVVPILGDPHPFLLKHILLAVSESKGLDLIFAATNDDIVMLFIFEPIKASTNSTTALSQCTLKVMKKKLENKGKIANY